MQKISKHYGAVRANDSINFSVQKGTIHALAGENGSGKSTLMKILFGLIEPDDSSSEIFISGKKVDFKSPHDSIQKGIGMVQQHFALAGALTALDNIILGAEPSHNGFIDRVKAEVILDQLAGEHLNVPWSKTTENLSVGYQQRIEILKLLFRHANILILDEPTAVLTPQEVEIFFSLLKRLRKEGKTVILITHKLNEVLSLCDHVTILRHGKVTAEMSTKGLTENDLIKAMIGRDIQPLQKPKAKMGDVLIKAEGLVVEDRHRGGLKGLNFNIRRGEILGIAGVEGSGQGALVESLLGICKYQGVIEYKNKLLNETAADRHKKLNFGLISEDRHEQSVWLQASIAENCAIGFTSQLSKFGFLSQKKMESHANELLKPYNVKMDTVHQPIASLSGGNQQKIVVAREISARKPDFLIASHPTRGVDVGAIEFIHQQLIDLRNKGAGILLISSELEELRALSDRILVLFEGRCGQEFEGPKYDTELIGKAMTVGRSS